AEADGGDIQPTPSQFSMFHRAPRSVSAALTSAATPHGSMECSGRTLLNVSASNFLIHKAGLTRASAVTGAVTLIQRFGSALNLNVHFYLLVLDGVYRREGEGRLRFVPVPAPTSAVKRLFVLE